MFRQATEKHLSLGVECVQLEGREGLWYEQPDILSKYKRRDDRLEKICYTQYGKMIRSGGKHVENYEKSVDTEDYGDETIVFC